MKIDNVKYKKITIELPVSTYDKLREYCKSPYRVSLFYKDVINYALLRFLNK